MKPGSTFASAASISAVLTRKSSTSTWSNSALYARSAASPSARTRAMMPFTLSSTLEVGSKRAKISSSLIFPISKILIMSLLLMLQLHGVYLLAARDDLRETVP